MKDKEKEKIIREWFSDNWAQLEINAMKCAGGNTRAYEMWYRDALVHVTEEFLKRDIDKQWKAFQGGKFENYMTRSLAIAVKSSTSSFYHKYRKKSRSDRELHPTYDYELYHENAEEEENNIIEKSEELKRALNNLDFYDRYFITQYYFEGKTAKQIAEATNIQPARVVRDIRKALEKLKEDIHIEDYE